MHVQAQHPYIAAQPLSQLSLALASSNIYIFGRQSSKPLFWQIQNVISIASHQILIALCVLNLPVASTGSASAALTVDTAGFWLSLTLPVIISLVEAALSILWTRIGITCNEVHPCKASFRIFGREVSVSIIDDADAQLATQGPPVGFHCGTESSASFSNGYSTYSYGSASEYSTCAGFETRHSNAIHGASEAVIDKSGSIMLVPTLMIRGLIRGDYSIGHLLENAIHLIVGLTDLSLGFSGLILNPKSPKALYDTLKDPRTLVTFENYSTLFLLYWILGALHAVCMIPLRSSRRSIQIFGWPGSIAFLVASLASLALFGVGCWKVNVAHREHQPWNPMLNYWIGGASAIGFPLLGVSNYFTHLASLVSSL